MISFFKGSNQVFAVATKEIISQENCEKLQWLFGNAEKINSEAVNGTFTGGPVAEDVESGGIDISYTGGYIDDIKDEIEAYRAKIISGEITVPSSR